MQIFNLWNFKLDADGRSCRFDVTAGQGYQIASGTETLLRNFLGLFGVEAEPSEWTFDPFCSAYFAFSGDGPWYKRIPAAWRARVALKAAPASPPPPYRGGYRESYEIDDSWTGSIEDEPWKYKERRCVVIADLFDGDPAGLQGYKNPLVESIEIVQLHSRVHQARFDLGVLKFPEEENRTDRVLGAIHSKISTYDYVGSLKAWANLKQ